MKKIKFVILLIFLLLPPPTAADPKELVNEWSVVIVDTNCIYVTWSEKYGPTQTIECIGLWESKDKYRLTFKDSRFFELRKDNVASIESWSDQ